MKRILLITILFVIPITALAAFDIDFTSQAPKGDWSQPWQDACEETSIVMVDAFYNDYNLDSDKAAQKIKTIFAIKEKFFGPSYDETAGLIVELINKHLPWEARLVKNPTIDQITFELDTNHPVIVPVHGGTLVNDHYKSNSIDYHMLVLVGYDESRQEFIAHDPGTRYGFRYHYSYSVVMAAMHDFLPNNKTLDGQKVVIFTTNKIIDSAETDGDNDGLLKFEELKWGTNLAQSDTDKDGFLDGEEVRAGYSPLVNELNIKDKSLVRDSSTLRIYLIDGKIKRHIQTLPTLFGYGQLYGSVINVSNKFISQFTNGQPIG